jgi:hypothetical protein
LQQLKYIAMSPVMHLGQSGHYAQYSLTHQLPLWDGQLVREVDTHGHNTSNGAEGAILCANFHVIPH